MRKSFSLISILLCVSFVVSSLVITSSAKTETSKAEMGTIEEILASYYDPNGRPMSCAHRAITYIGNPIPENSLLAIQDAIDHRVDIVELDIMRTKDGVYVLCHDDTIRRTTTYSGYLNVSEMTYEEICNYPLLKYTGDTGEIYYDENGNTLVMPTFEDALELCKGKIMINLDKFTGQWDRRMELYEIVRKHGCLDIVMFKGGYDSAKIKGWHNEIKNKYGSDAVMPNFCTLNANRNADEWVKQIKEHHDSATAFAVEAGFSDYTQPQSNPEVVARVKQYARVFGNVLYESIGGTHSAKNKENSTGWAELISLGHNILQTNNSADLASYIYANYSTPTRNIENGIDLLYFSNFRHNQTSYTIEIDAPSVKLYNGDYICFNNVDFGNSDGKSLIAKIAGHSGSGRLVIRKDSQDGEILAIFSLGGELNTSATLVKELTAKSIGVCNVYVCAEGMGDDYVSVTRLITADPSEAQIDRVEIPSVFTRPGVKPLLPSRVKIVNEYGLSYKSDVIWSPIPEECYSEDLTYFKVSGILKENCQRIYASVTVIDIDMSGAVIWFDSRGDKLLNESGEVLEWYDSIGGITARAQSNKAPTYSDGVISFDGFNDSMIYEHSLSDKGNISIILNAKTEKSSTDYMSEYKINNSARYTLLHYPESGSWGSVYFTAFKNGIACRFGSGESNNRGIYFTGTQLDGWSTVSAVKNGTSEKLYVGASSVYDRALDSSDTYQMGDPGDAVKATHEYSYIGYGIQASENYYYEGDVADIVVFERTLSEIEVAKLDAYFRAKNQNELKDKSDIATAEFDNYVDNNREKLHTLKYSDFDAAYHTARCKNCPYIATLAHSFTYSKRDEEEHTKRCSLCAFAYKEEHRYELEDTTDRGSLHRCADCNAEKFILKAEPVLDTSILIIVSALAFVALAGGVAAFLAYKKKQKKRS